MRVVLLTGKGGVGKTSLAAATAVRAARRGARTLVVSTDPAHSLADALGQAVGGEPTAVADGLLAQQIDARAHLEAHWRRIQDYLVGVLSGGGVSELEAEELALLPGLEEVFALLEVRQRVAEGGHDLIVVDCAPTAETLRLLSLPQALGRYLDHLAPLSRAWGQVVRPLRAAGESAPPPPGAAVLAALDELRDSLEQARALLADPERTSLRLVVNPERVVLAEGRRLLGQLTLLGYPVDAVVANRVLPAGSPDPLVAAWQARQDEALAELGDDVAGAPLLVAPQQAAEPVGVPALAELADALYGTRDERAVLHRGAALRVEACGRGWELRLPLPGVERDEVAVHRTGDELLVRVGATTRAVLLPAALRRGEVAGARLEGGELRVRVAPPDAAPQGAQAGAL